MDPDKAQRLTIVLPCYKPAEDWESMVVKIHNELSQAFPVLLIQLVIVNDGTPFLRLPDLLRQKIPASQFQFIEYEKNQGKGHALRTGVAAMQAEYYLLTDIDFPYTLESMVNMLSSLLSNDTDIIIGVRQKSYFKEIPRSRMIISKSLQWMNKHLLRLKIYDTQCGLKGMNQIGADLFVKTHLNGFLYDIEFIKMASKNKNLTLDSCDVELRKGIIMSSVNFSLLFKELGHFLRLLFS